MPEQPVRVERVESDVPCSTFNTPRAYLMLGQTEHPNPGTWTHTEGNPSFFSSAAPGLMVFLENFFPPTLYIHDSLHSTSILEARNFKKIKITLKLLPFEIFISA
ncbi:unnamed protein product [Allacma fusca]|uniref:Uncharacterized protein n=1 Tax=Allacma fusca TaxID=39272 RepID=A0A8J2LS11_9HEXA|nr:unnamed protein product [Allacma fusca]